MKKLFLIGLVLLFASCQNGLKKKIEQKIIPQLNNPKSYEFVSLTLIDSVSNHEYNKNLIDSLTFQVNKNSYRILDMLYDKKHKVELEKIQSLSKKVRLLKEESISSNSTNTWKKTKLEEIKYDKLTKEYEYQKRTKYFGGLDYSMLEEKNEIIWDSLIKMSRTKLNVYLDKAEPSFETRFGIKNDSIVKTFKLVDSLQLSIKETKPKINFYTFELSYREKNNFNAIILNKLRIVTLPDKKSIYNFKK